MKETNVFFDKLDELDAVCRENKFEYDFSYQDYPIKLTIKAMDRKQETENNNPDITFEIINGDLLYAISKDFTIQDKIFGRIKSLFQKLHYSYLQMFHRDVVEGRLLKAKYNPEPPDDDSPGKQHERHYIITKTVKNTETVLYDYPKDYKDAAIKKFKTLGKRTKEGEGVICLYRGFTKLNDSGHKEMYEDAEQIAIYDKWSIANGYVNFDNL